MNDIVGMLRDQDQIIAAHGWAITAVLPTPGSPPTDQPFAYTIGLTTFGYPELLITGLHPHVAGPILNSVARRTYQYGERFTAGQRVPDVIATGLELLVLDGDWTDALRPATALARYRPDELRLQQLVWPDPEGHYPWQPHYQLDPTHQPLLTTRPSSPT